MTPSAPRGALHQLVEIDGFPGRLRTHMEDYAIIEQNRQLEAGIAVFVNG
jgi:hypothetical protein